METRVKGIVLAIFLTIGMAVLFSGCTEQKEQQQEEAKKELDYTVCKEENLPKELRRIIGEKKENSFKLTYTTKDYRYIAVGYGKKETGGYSIEVNQLYETSKEVHFETTLLGPSKEEQEIKGETYPYIVVKTQCSEKSVVFD